MDNHEAAWSGDFADVPQDAARLAIETATLPDAWPVPGKLRDDLPPVPPLDPAMLPGELQPWCSDISERMNCPPDFVAIPAMVAAASLLGRRIAIRPQQHTTWQEAGNLWGCIVGPPGALKSPALREVLKPLALLEAGASKDNQAALQDYESRMSLHKLELDSASASAKKSLKDGNSEGALATLARVAPPERPAQRRYIVNDATVERLGEICADNSQGLLVQRDELLTLFADLDREEKAPARGFFLTAWTGSDSYTFDRIMRGRTHCPAVNFSLLGTTQPTRLANYIRQSLHSMNDGMVQRLQMLAWPDMSGTFREVDRHPDAAAREQAFACFNRLAQLDARAMGGELDRFDGPDAVPFLHFGPYAQGTFSEWRAALETRLRGGDLSAALTDHLSKYRGLIPRLALLCHLASGGHGPVSLPATRQALAWADYLEAHAARAYASTGHANAETARLLWRRVVKSELPHAFTARDVQRKGWSGLADKARVAAALETLIDADWLAAETVDTGGRPSVIYRPNPLALAR